MGLRDVESAPELVLVVVVVGVCHDGLPYQLEENPPSGLRTEIIPSA